MIPGVTFDGGYADYLNVPAQALAQIPDVLKSADAAPLLCAGITTFNALRHSGATAGDLVAILGVGGLGHLGVQFANKMGFRTVAVARGDDKAGFVHKLGAHHYIDTVKQDVAKELTALGGAKVILATLNNADAMSAAIGGLGTDGKFVMLGVPMEPVKVMPVQMILRRQSLSGWPSGVAADSEDTLKFTALTGVQAMIERYPLEKTAQAYDRMMSGEARFRVVIETGA
jgi:D-arabinose 1-dehydrogenase-like Zn-dependent alcohol dehydrogenase